MVWQPLDRGSHSERLAVHLHGKVPTPCPMAKPRCALEKIVHTRKGLMLDELFSQINIIEKKDIAMDVDIQHTPDVEALEKGQAWRETHKHPLPFICSPMCPSNLINQREL